MNGDTRMTDGELAAAFALTGSSDPFDELVRRHVRMVFRTCRRVTGDHHDAEDATQAVFGTLASHAASLTSYGSLAGWLYSTAWNVARRTRAARATRLRYEQRLNPAPTYPLHPQLSDDELSELYRAMRMLPPDYLHAIVLHHLEGMTIAQVAEVTGCSVGTTAARLSRARAIVRERLARRGVALSMGAFSSAMALETAAQDVVSPTVLAQVPLTPAIGAAHFGLAAGAGSGGAATVTIVGWTTKWAVAACIAVSVGTGSIAASRVARPTPAAASSGASQKKTVVATSSAQSSTTFGGKMDTVDWTSLRPVSTAVPEPGVLSLLGFAMLAARRPRRRPSVVA